MSKGHKKHHKKKHTNGHHQDAESRIASLTPVDGEVDDAQQTYVMFTFNGETLALAPDDARAYAENLILAAQDLIVAANEAEARMAVDDGPTETDA